MLEYLDKFNSNINYKVKYNGDMKDIFIYFSNINEPIILDNLKKIKLKNIENNSNYNSTNYLSLRRNTVNLINILTDNRPFNIKNILRHIWNNLSDNERNYYINKYLDDYKVIFK